MAELRNAWQTRCAFWCCLLVAACARQPERQSMAKVHSALSVDAGIPVDEPVYGATGGMRVVEVSAGDAGTFALVSVGATSLCGKVLSDGRFAPSGTYQGSYFPVAGGEGEFLAENSFLSLARYDSSCAVKTAIAINAYDARRFSDGWLLQTIGFGVNTFDFVFLGDDGGLTPLPAKTTYPYTVLARQGVNAVMVTEAPYTPPGSPFVSAEWFDPHDGGIFAAQTLPRDPTSFGHSVAVTETETAIAWADGPIGVVGRYATGTQLNRLNVGAGVPPIVAGARPFRIDR